VTFSSTTRRILAELETSQKIASSDHVQSILEVGRALARDNDPRAQLAQSILPSCLACLEQGDSFRQSFKSDVLSGIPKVRWFDDKFWCVLLMLLDRTGKDNTHLGGPIHQMILEIHDDFDPRDMIDG